MTTIKLPPDIVRAQDRLRLARGTLGVLEARQCLARAWAREARRHGVRVSSYDFIDAADELARREAMS